MNPATIDTIIVIAARAAHEANRAYCEALDDLSQPEWRFAPSWQRASAIEGVKAVMENPRMTPEGSHVSWLEHKAADGWKYGPVKDPEKKEHPCFVPYNQLPAAQKAKDAIFQAVVRGVLAHYIGGACP